MDIVDQFRFASNIAGMKRLIYPHSSTIEIILIDHFTLDLFHDFCDILSLCFTTDELHHLYIFLHNVHFVRVVNIYSY